MPGLRQRRALLAGLAAAGLWPGAAQPAFDRRRHGLVVMLRHAATEPGVGDPPGYTLGDCASQRNLSAAGRAQARRLAAALATQGLQPTQVKSSRWCRCLDTARLVMADGGAGSGDGVEPWPALDSFFDAAEREPAQTAALREALAALPAGQVALWVTHMVNIAALVGEGVAMGEAVVLRGERQADGGVRVLRLGRVLTAAAAP